MYVVYINARTRALQLDSKAYINHPKTDSGFAQAVHIKPIVPRSWQLVTESVLIGLAVPLF